MGKPYPVRVLPTLDRTLNVLPLSVEEGEDRCASNPTRSPV